MWHLQVRNDRYLSYLFHTMDDVAAFVLGQAKEMYSYELDFVPIWQPPQPKRPENEASENLTQVARPVPMSHTEPL